MTTVSGQPQAERAATARPVAAIDIGSNSLRLAIAQVFPDGQTEVLERLQRAVRLGQDTFRRGRLSSDTMRAAVGVLRDYRKMLDLYGVQRVRAVATSAVREAANSDTFIDRIFMGTGLDVEVIHTSEESRLTVSAVRESVGHGHGVDRNDTLIVEVGGGSTLLTKLHKGEIASSQTVALGSIRLQESLATASETPARGEELLRQQITNAVATLEGQLPLAKVRLVIAVGGDARFAASRMGRKLEGTDLATISAADFDKLVEECGGQSAEELVKRYGLAFAEAETLNPALLVYQSLLRATRARAMLVSGVSMRDGLLLDLARSVTGQEDKTLLEGVIHAAEAIAQKYMVSMEHGRHVADLAVRLFDDMRDEHRLGPRERLLLYVAGLLHEVGSYVSARAHHKHSYYLIVNSEIFGLTRDEIAIVALVARYHRRSFPKPSHVEYTSMPRETRMIVSKLAALLRVADGLDRSHTQQIRDFRSDLGGDELVLTAPGASDLTLERRAMAAKADLFEEVYGVKLRLEEGRPVVNRPPSQPRNG